MPLRHGYLPREQQEGRTEESAVRRHAGPSAVSAGRKESPSTLGVTLTPNWSQELPKAPGRRRDSIPPCILPGAQGKNPALRTAPLPALGLSAPRGRCSSPQAGIAASRHRASSSASLLLLLQLSESLMAPPGATILRGRRGWWGKRPCLL